jgi:zinc protease
MGYLLGAVTQEKLDNQRGVVQNEKRQGDNQPGGLVFYELLATLFPEGHPYHHSDRLDGRPRRRLDGRRSQVVHDKYGPNNAAAVTVSRYWPMPGILDRQLVALDVGGSVLGGLASSRLDRILVREEKTAVSVSAGLYPQQRVGIFYAQATVKPGVDPALVEQRLDEIIADYIANGRPKTRCAGRRPRRSAAGSAALSKSAASAARRSPLRMAKCSPETAHSIAGRLPITRP